MSDPTPLTTPPKRTVRSLLLGTGLAAILGGAGFYAVHSGLILAPEAEAATAPHEAIPAPLHGPAAMPDVAFVELAPMVISLPRESASRHLRFRAALEVPSGSAQDVEHLKPRIVDALNTYLRAVDPAELSRPGALITLRDQMQRRVALAVGEDRVASLLIMEFVLD